MSDEKQRRPPIEDLDRLHGEATMSRGEATDEERVAFCQRRFEEDVSAAWPKVSEYIRGLELELHETKRQLKIADDLRIEWKEQFFDVAKAERKMRAVIVSCRRLTHPRNRMPDAEKLEHIQRMTAEAAPPEILRAQQKPADAALGDTDE